MYYYEVEIRHAGLNKYRHIKGSDKYVVNQKAESQMAQWNEQYAKIEEKEARLAATELSQITADRQTQEAIERIEEAKNILNDTLTVNDAIDFKTLLVTDIFKKPQPQKPKAPIFPKEPQASDAQFNIGDSELMPPKRTLLSVVLPFVHRGRVVKHTDKTRMKKDLMHVKFLKAHEIWEQETKRLEANYEIMKQEFIRQGKKWIADRDKFNAERDENNEAVIRLEKNFKNKDQNSVQEYFILVLERSNYPSFYTKDFFLTYSKNNKRIIVDVRLPNIEDIPSLIQVRYVKIKDHFEEKFISTSEKNKLYDSVVSQIALRTIHELFEADIDNDLEAVAFNGYLDYIDKATGKDSSAVLLSVFSNKKDFCEIDLARVDPIFCLKSLKAVFSPKIHAITPIQPIMENDKTDKRFIDGVNTIDGVNDSTNLATISWEDFEHLIRDLFEQEFISGGGEVKVTRASRDGGVDAVIFDPDPIRGGKIVVQAKRYTNTVGVSAVRDLYGTLLNEGATKGILVTTSQYGADAYNFAKGKPITLLDGARLLFLLEKHGKKARINLTEAKSINKENGY